MDKVQTGEKPQSRAKEEIIREAKRIEEALLFSSKGHFNAGAFWGQFHLWIGIPVVILSAVAGAAAFRKFDPDFIVAGVLSILAAVLSAVMTFLNPNERKSSHLNAGNQYAALQDQVRIFWSIDCWRDDSETVLTDRLKQFSDQKDRLNRSSPAIPTWAYKRAKKGIEGGEASYSVDKSS